MSASIIMVYKQNMSEVSKEDAELLNPNPNQYEYFRQTRNIIYYKPKNLTETDAETQLANLMAAMAINGINGGKRKSRRVKRRKTRRSRKSRKSSRH